MGVADKGDGRELWMRMDVEGPSGMKEDVYCCCRLGLFSLDVVDGRP
jgi:hypothetical protein